MTLLKIAHIGNPVLRRPAREVGRQELVRPETQHFIDDLVETMRDANGAGLAAIQVHEPLRICAIEQRAPNPRYPGRPAVPLTVIVNPVIDPLSEERFDNFEGCLSVPDLRGLVPRWAEVRISGWNRDGSSFEREIRGITAGTFQHEIDHLDGVLFVDRVVDRTSLCSYQNFLRYHEEPFAERVRELVARYGS